MFGLFLWTCVYLVSILWSRLTHKTNIDRKLDPITGGDIYFAFILYLILTFTLGFSFDWLMGELCFPD